jgi:hypothetical protein
LPVVGQLVASAEWLHTKTNNGIFYQHLNLGAPTATGQRRPRAVLPSRRLQRQLLECHHRQRHHQRRLCHAQRAIAHAGTQQPASTTCYLAKETSEGQGDAVTLSISKPAATGLAGAWPTPHLGHRSQPADFLDVRFQLGQPQHLQPQ